MSIIRELNAAKKMTTPPSYRLLSLIKLDFPRSQGEPPVDVHFLQNARRRRRQAFCRARPDTFAWTHTRTHALFRSPTSKEVRLRTHARTTMSAMLCTPPRAHLRTPTCCRGARLTTRAVLTPPPSKATKTPFGSSKQRGSPGKVLTYLGNDGQAPGAMATGSALEQASRLSAASRQSISDAEDWSSDSDTVFPKLTSPIHL